MKFNALFWKFQHSFFLIRRIVELSIYFHIFLDMVTILDAKDSWTFIEWNGKVFHSLTSFESSFLRAKIITEKSMWAFITVNANFFGIPSSRYQITHKWNPDIQPYGLWPNIRSDFEKSSIAIWST